MRVWVQGNWNGTVVAVKVLKETGAMAMGDFRTELNVLQKVHHPHTVRVRGSERSCAAAAARPAPLLCRMAAWPPSALRLCLHALGGPTHA